MSRETDLLRSLDDDPGTPSTVDPLRAIATARRRRARGRAGYAGAAALAVVAVAGAAVAAGPPPGEPARPPAAQVTTADVPAASAPAVSAPAAPISCALRRLVPPGTAPMALVSGADPTGRHIVGRSYPRSGGYQAVLWTDGTGRAVMLPGDAEEALTDVNSSGTAVGWSYAGGGPVPYAYHRGRVVKLAGVRHGSAYAINEAGAVVGDDGAGHALVWPSVTAKPARLPAPAGAAAVHAGDIDEDGTVVGSLGSRTPYVWFPDGTHRALPMPLIDGKPAAIAQARHIRDGWVTGMAAAVTMQQNKGRVPPVLAVRWNLRTGTTEFIDALESPADAVNASGWQVGTAPGGHAVLVAGKRTVVLPGLGRHREDGTATIPATLSDDGRLITGQSDDRNGVIQAVMWRCG